MSSLPTLQCDILHGVNPVILCLGGGQNLNRTDGDLDKVLKDLLLQVFVCGSCAVMGLLRLAKLHCNVLTLYKSISVIDGVAFVSFGNPCFYFQSFVRPLSEHIGEKWEEFELKVIKLCSTILTG